MLSAPGTAAAHSFGQVYNLPLPFWLYGWGAAAALTASFLVIAYFVSAGHTRKQPWQRDLADSLLLKAANRAHVLAGFQFLSVGGLVLCVLTGFLGSKSPYGNFNMTFFWIVFVLGFTYLTALIGDFYAALNPWKLIVAGIGRIFPAYLRGVLRYPEPLAYWPALLFYMGFIWIELFGHSEPFSLALMLSGYSLINFIGVGLVGARDWFRYCEFLSVFFRLIARMAPVDYVPADVDGQGGRLCLRAPFAGLIEPAERHLSLLLFVLFMLSSTAFDGLRETIIWKRLFWLDLYQGFLQYRIGSNPLAAFPLMRELFLYWQSAWLVLSPFIYFVIYFAFITLSRWMARSRQPIHELALQFTLPLLPIALVYNITHYYTLIQTQGVKIISLASDPFGRGSNLFGTADWLQWTIIPDANFVWHVQVGLIVFGHIVSVYIAHLVALRVFPTQRQALLSQLPMLLLMVVFTTAGLWILSRPMG